MENEIWLPVKGFEGFYDVSNLGSVRSIDRKFITSNNTYHTIKGRTLKGRLNRHGYLDYTLCKSGVKSSFTGHKLVAMCFLVNPLNQPMVNHIDTVKTNNRADNLEWINGQGNMDHAKLNGLIWENDRCTWAKLSVSIVRQTRYTYSHGNITQRELSDRYNVSQSAITQLLNYKTWKHI